MDGHTKSLILWRPKHGRKSEVDRLCQFINNRHGLRLTNYAELHAYSIADETASDFWVDLFLFMDMKSDKVPSYSYKRGVKGVMFPPPQFFPEIRLNFAENLIAGKTSNEIAIHACNEGGTDLHDVTWNQLYKLVEKLADSMRASGVKKGSRVAAIISNRVETMALCLATLSIGAIWSTSSPDMGTQGILDRLMQIRPTLVFGETSVLYNGTIRDLRSKHAQCDEQLASIPEYGGYIIIGDALNPLDDGSLARLQPWRHFLRRGTGRKLAFEPVPFIHPGFIVYSSGTTGKPKCIVHSAAGLLLQVKKDTVLGYDVRPGDTIMQYTTTGWIMWAMVLCGLAYGGRVVVYDGSPLKPDMLTLFRLIERLKVSLFGTSARFLSDLKAAKINPKEHLNLSSLRTVSSTGSILTAEVATWFYAEGFPHDVHLVSTSGGTDLACSLVHGYPTLPVYAGESSAESLGMAVDVADVSQESFESIKNSGEPGELVCTKPFPSQPVEFWGDRNSQRYFESYFQRFGPGVWNQGDFVRVNPNTKGIVMLGRSDGVLNPSGVRFGSADIYNVVEKFTFVEDSLCVGQCRSQDADEIVLLFLKTKSNVKLTKEMEQTIKTAIQTAHSPRHVPKHIFQVADIPYTINGKKIEIAVKQIVSGKNVTPSGAVANPEALNLYKKFYHIEELVAPIGNSRL